MAEEHRGPGGPGEAHRLPGAVVPVTRDWERRTFGPFGQRALRAVGEAFFTDPEVEDRGAAARFAWLAADVDHFLGQASVSLRSGARIALFLLEVLPIFVVGRFAFASSLPIAERARYLAKIEASPVPYVGVLCIMFKTLMTVLYFEHPEAAPMLGYDGVHERASRTRGLPVLDASSADERRAAGGAS